MEDEYEDVDEYQDYENYDNEMEDEYDDIDEYYDDSGIYIVFFLHFIYGN